EAIPFIKQQLTVGRGHQKRKILRALVKTRNNDVHGKLGKEIELLSRDLDPDTKQIALQLYAAKSQSKAKGSGAENVK
ncbi:MAG: hypothetical protein AAF497_28820, partial [Planctomycetota bacterium]